MQIITGLFVLSSALFVISLADPGVMRIPVYHFPSEKDVGPIKRYLQSYREGVKMQSDLPQLDLMKFQQSTRFYGHIFVGTPPQLERVVINTASSELWLPSSDCHTMACTHRITVGYDSSASSTSKVTDKSIFAEFPQNFNISGPIYQDNVIVAGVKVEKQEFAATVMTGEGYMTIEWDGMLGMTTAESQLPSVFSNMISQGLIAQPVFSYYLDRDRFLGELFLGGSDPRHYFGSLKYTDVLQPGYWNLPMHSFTVGNNSYCTDFSECGYAKMDTGSTVIYGPATAIEHINNLIGGHQVGVVRMVSCDDIDSLPTIFFKFGNNQFKFTPEEYIIMETDPEYRVKVCASAFQDHRHPTQFWTFGDIFFRSHYVEFDSGRNRIGIAHSKTSVDF